LSWFVTQFTFAFVTSPFVLLSLSESWLVWSRVYFYAAIGTALATAFFTSPAKGWLRHQLQEREAKAGSKLKKSLSQDSLSSQQPVMGLPPEDLDEAINEIKREVAKQRKRSMRSEEVRGK
jgi:lysophospholipid acyltransferase